MLSKKMIARLFVLSFVLIVLTSTALFFSLSQSYQESIQARFYYAMGDFQEALHLSEEALKKDMYNKMAFTMKAQSKVSLEFIEYIDEAEAYLSEIESLARDDVTKSTQIRVKMICEIMIEKYYKLNNNNFLIDDNLKSGAKILYLKFLELYNDIVNRI